MGQISFGEWMGILSALVWAVTALMLRTQSLTVPPVVMNATRSLAGAVFFWVLLPFGEPVEAFRAIPGFQWALLYGAVLIGPVTGETLYLAAIRDIGIARTLALTGTFPLSTLMWEQILLGTPVTGTFVAGSCLVVAGIIGTGFGSIAFLEAVARIGPAKTATLSSCAPVFGLIFGVAFLKERLTARLCLGVALCLAGVWMVL